MKKIIFTIFGLTCGLLYARVVEPSDEIKEAAVPGNEIISYIIPSPDTINPYARAYERDEAMKFCRNDIYFELLGPGILYSINYDYRISTHFFLRAGLSTWHIHNLDLFVFQLKDFRFTSFPLMINYMTGRKANHFEVGIGAMPAFLSTSGATIFYMMSSGASKANVLLGTGVLGYRYQRDDGGFMFRAGLTPLFDLYKLTFTIGVSIGYAF